MTASVQYWRLPDEEADLVAYLQSLGPTTAIPVRRVARADELVWRPVADALREPDESFLITPAAFAPAMNVHRNDDGFAPDVVTTPALYYARGRLVAPSRLYSTSMSAEWSHLDVETQSTVDKPADFVRWGKKVMQWVRRAAPGWHRYKHHRITPRADAAREAGMEMVF
jgi:hypothetical protein